MRSAIGSTTQLQAPVDLIRAGRSGTRTCTPNCCTASPTISSTAGSQTLIVIDSNPAYDTPGELAFGELIATVPFTAHLGLYDNETAARCKWHLPLSHTLESWSDLRAFEGTASIVQPLIRPLYDTRTAHHLVGLLQGNLSTSPYQVGARDMAGSRPISTRNGGAGCMTV